MRRRVFIPVTLLVGAVAALMLASGGSLVSRVLGVTPIPGTVGDQAEPSIAPLPATAGTTPADAGLAAAGLVDDAGILDVSAVRSLLIEIPVDDVAPASEYDRDAFGQRWADTNRNGCDTRNDLLSRDLVDVTFKPGTRDCVVLTGTLSDPYTGASVGFVRGEGTSELVPIDHVVALSWAFQNGADTWAADTREAFANDPMNLQATTRDVNTSKLDRGPAEWLPPATGYRCAYIARFVLISSTYDLTMPTTDIAAAAAVLDQCAAAPTGN